MRVLYSLIKWDGGKGGVVVGGVGGGRGHDIHVSGMGRQRFASVIVFVVYWSSAVTKNNKSSCAKISAECVAYASVYNYVIWLQCHWVLRVSDGIPPPPSALKQNKPTEISKKITAWSDPRPHVTQLLRLSGCGSDPHRHTTDSVHKNRRARLTNWFGNRPLTISDSEKLTYPAGAAKTGALTYSTTGIQIQWRHKNY